MWLWSLRMISGWRHTRWSWLPPSASVWQKIAKTNTDIFGKNSEQYSIQSVLFCFFCILLLFEKTSLICILVTSDQISTFFNIYRHKSLVLAQFHLTPSNTKFYWPSTTKYQQPVTPHPDIAPPNTNQYRLLLTQYYHVSTSPASYWRSNIMYQPILPYTHPVQPSTDQYRLILTQYHQL